MYLEKLFQKELKLIIPEIISDSYSKRWTLCVICKQFSFIKKHFVVSPVSFLLTHTIALCVEQSANFYVFFWHISCLLVQLLTQKICFSCLLNTIHSPRINQQYMCLCLHNLLGLIYIPVYRHVCAHTLGIIIQTKDIDGCHEKGRKFNREQC